MTWAKIQITHSTSSSYSSQQLHCFTIPFSKKRLNFYLSKGCLCTMLVQKETIEMDRISNAADEEHKQHPELQRNESQKTNTQFHSWSCSSSLGNKHSQYSLPPWKHLTQVTKGVWGVTWNIFTSKQQQSSRCFPTVPAPSRVQRTGSHRHRLTKHTPLPFPS